MTDTDPETPHEKLKRGHELREQADELIADIEADVEDAAAEWFGADMIVEATAIPESQRVRVEVQPQSPPDLSAFDDDVAVSMPEPMRFYLYEEDEFSRTDIRGMKEIAAEVQDAHDDGAPIEKVLYRAEAEGMNRGDAKRELEKMKQRGEAFEPRDGYLHTL